MDSFIPVDPAGRRERQPSRRLDNSQADRTETRRRVSPGATAVWAVAGLCAAVLAPPARAALDDISGTNLPAIAGDAYSVAIGDVNGDGIPDAFISVNGQSVLLVNDGAGQFTDDSATRLPVLADGTVSAVFVNVDGDADLDLFLANDGQNRLLINNAGVYTDQTDTRLPAGAQITIAAAAGDIDGANGPDLVLANRGSRNRVLINNGAGVFTDATNTSLPADSDLSYDALLIDADANGTLDLFVANGDGQNRLLLNNGLGVFADVSGASLPTAGDATTDAMALDVDADGDIDVVLANGPDGAAVLLNDGAGVFSAGALPALDDFTIRLATADVDFDGTADLVLANAGQDRVLLNDGLGNFTDATGAELPADTRRSFGLGAADFNDDLDEDVLVAAPEGENRLLGQGIGFPRVLATVSPDYVEVGDTVTVDITTFDEGTIVSTTLTIEQPDTSTVNVPVVGNSGSFVPTQAGAHVAIVQAQDNDAMVGTRNVPFNVETPDTTDPIVTVSVDAPPGLLFGQNVTITVTATDDRAVTGRTLTVNGTPVPLDSSGIAVYTTNTVGLHTVVAGATDAAGNAGSDSTTFNVGADNDAPSVAVAAAPDPVDLANPVAITATAVDNVDVTSFVVTVTGPGDPGGAVVAIDGAGEGTYVPFLPGTYTVDGLASDPAGNSGSDSVTFEAIGVPDVLPPDVTLTITPRTVAIGGSVDINVSATDDINVSSLALAINGVPVLLDGSGNATYTPPVVGDYNAEASALDPTGNEGTAADLFRAVDPAADNEFPVVEITAPAEDVEVTMLTDVVGSVSDDTLVGYTLSYAPVGSDSFVEFATGDAEVSDDVLGAFDPTMLENGFYTVRLAATDINGLIGIDEAVVNVAGALKLGNFVVSFLDRTLNLGKLPINVTRSYDSRNRHEVGDFGYGWDIYLTQAELIENRSPGVDWFQDVAGSFIPTYFIVEDRPHIITIRFAESDEKTFVPSPVPESQQLLPIDFLTGMNFTAVGDTTGTLVPNRPPDYFIFNEIVDETLDTYNPESYTYTAEDGFVYVFTEDSPNSLRHKLTRVTDPNGVVVDITPNGFIRSDGASVTFVRDGQGRVTKITDPNGNEVIYTYNGAGDLASVRDPELNTVTFVYDADHQLTDIMDPLGRPTQRQEYDDDGRLVAITDADGMRIELEYDVTGNTQIVRDRRGNATIYEYDDRGNVLMQTEFPQVDGVVEPILTERAYNEDSQILLEINPNGVVTEFVYSAEGRLESRTEDVGGLDLLEAFTYNAMGNTLTASDPRGNLVINTYDASGNKLTSIDRDGKLSSWEYNGDGLATRETDARGNYWLYTYDGMGSQLTADRYDSSDNLVQKMAFTYDANGNRLTETIFVTIDSVETPLTTTYTYNGNNQVLTQTNARGFTQEFEYDELGRRSVVLDELDNRTESEFDDVGNLLSTSYPDGTDQLLGYDVDGNRTSETSRNGHTTTFVYDGVNRLVQVNLPGGAIRESRFDPAGNLIGEIDELGSRTDHDYDGPGRRTRTLQPEVYDAAADALVRPQTLYEYDENGNRTAVVDANNSRTEFVYDGNNRLTETRYPGNVSSFVGYDPVGNEISRTDPEGITTTFEYDALNRLVVTRLPDPSGGIDQSETSYVYDEAGRLLEQTDANNHTTKFEYDAAGNRTARVLPGLQREEFVYDEANNLVTHTHFDDETTVFGHDEVGRATSIVYSDGDTVALSYLGEGQRSQAVDSRGTTAYVYDNRGRLETVTDPDGVVVSYTYDDAGNKLSVTTPGGITQFAYDDLQRMSTVTDSDDGATTYGYDAVGNLVLVQHPNGTRAEYVYNNRNQLTSLSNLRADDSVISSYAYALNDNGLRTQVTENDGSIVTYVYDDNYRLTRETRTGANAFDDQYTYDDVGNRTSVNRDGALTNFVYDVNDRLQSAGPVTYTYDASGNRTTRSEGGNTTTYTYNVAGRLVSAEESGGAITDYVYDPDGNRVEKTDSGGTTRYVVDTRNVSGVAQVLEEQDGGGAVQALYAYGHDLASQKRGATRSFYHYDGSGNTRSLTNGAATLTDSYLYDAYGVELATSGSTVNSYRFAGEQFDTNLGLYYLRARYYDRDTGRFTSMDPFMGDPQSPISLHRYLYANDNPVHFIDPTGEFSLISVSISISINSNLQATYTQQLVKFFFKAAKIAFCQLEPAYKMQAIGFDLIARNLPGEHLINLAQDQIVAGYQAIGAAGAAALRNTVDSIISVKLEVGINFDGIIQGLLGSNSPVPGQIAKVQELKGQVDGFLGKFKSGVALADAATSGSSCALFTAADENADFILGLIPGL